MTAVLVSKIYISGPMTGLPGHNFAAFNEAAAELRDLGFEVEDPAEKGVIDGWKWEDYLRYDLVKMLECDGIYLLPGWEKSRGAQLEVYVAKALGFKLVLADGDCIDLIKALPTVGYGNPVVRS